MVVMSATRAASPPAPVVSEQHLNDYELLLFKSKEAYVYRVPPAGTAGHRAGLWNVDKWLSEVSVKIVRFSTDEASIQLADPASGELFAECPVTLPLVTCVEGVVDSSRYFVIRVVDRETGHHAFIGLGFRERNEASDFNAALSEHQQYLERKQAAAMMRKQFDDAYKEDGEATENTRVGKKPQPSPSVDYSLRPGEKLNLNLHTGLTGSGFVTSRGKLTKSFSLMFDPENGGAAMAALAPPPPRRATDDEKPMGLSPCYRKTPAVEEEAFENGSTVAGSEDETAWGDFESA